MAQSVKGKQAINQSYNNLKQSKTEPINRTIKITKHTQTSTQNQEEEKTFQKGRTKTSSLLSLPGKYLPTIRNTRFPDLSEP